MRHETKSFAAEFKALDVKTGEFTAVVSVFGNVDYGGDRVMPGAFDKTLAAWQAKGDPIPVIWSHMWDDPSAHIGYVDPKDAVATPEGLQVKGVLDVDRPFAEQVHHLMKSRRVTEFSFGYYANAYDYVEENGAQIRQLTELDLFEVGPTLKGMNPDTRLMEAASALLDQAKNTATLEATVDAEVADAEPVTDAVDTAAEDSAPETPEGDLLAGDTSNTIDTERLADLLVMPRHKE